MASVVSERSRASAIPVPERRGPRPAVVVLVAVMVALAGFLAVYLGGRGEVAAQPEFTYEDGSTGSLADFQGEPVIAHFFASWALPQRNYLPTFDEVQHRLEGAVRVIGINHDLTEAEWRAFVEDAEVEHLTVFQPGQEIFEEAGGSGLPSTLFVDANGEVVHLSTGLLTSEQLVEVIADHLGIEP